ncbi:MAG: hypothetical protein LBS01_02550 [Prevotellaceae bacterium]|jgi:hypothetical protein|nr:hypothetical protein [Prevotellaceae bacterium]
MSNNNSTRQTAESRTINSVGQRPTEQNAHNTQAPTGRNQYCHNINIK